MRLRASEFAGDVSANGLTSEGTGGTSSKTTKRASNGSTSGATKSASTHSHPSTDALSGGLLHGHFTDDLYLAGQRLNLIRRLRAACNFVQAGFRKTTRISHAPFEGLDVSGAEVLPVDSLGNLPAGI